MYIIDEIIDDLSFELSSKAAVPEADPTDVIFFDIETTGLSPSRSGLYLVGCMFVDGKNTVLRQFFADDHEDEKKVLAAFSEALSGKGHMVHFNGSTFDIPYLKTKYEQHGLKDPFSEKKSCDIYRKLMPLKKRFSLKSMKQKALEEFLGIFREDIYTGGELISVYKAYQKAVLLERAGGMKGNTLAIGEMRNALLLHNSDDIKGMLPVAQLLGIVSFVKGDFEVCEPYFEDGAIRIGIEPHKKLSSRLFEGKGPFKFIACDEAGALSIKVPLIKDSLRLFMKDFREHYYIPSKDMAVHADVAAFISPHDKKRATPATCYVPCRGEFLTVNEEDLPEGMPLIKRDYGERIAFVRKQDISPEVLKAAVMYRLNFIDQHSKII